MYFENFGFLDPKKNHLNRSNLNLLSALREVLLNVKYQFGVPCLAKYIDD